MPLFITPKFYMRVSYAVVRAVSMTMALFSLFTIQYGSKPYEQKLLYYFANVNYTANSRTIISLIIFSV